MKPHPTLLLLLSSLPVLGCSSPEQETTASNDQALAATTTNTCSSSPVPACIQGTLSSWLDAGGDALPPLVSAVRSTSPLVTRGAQSEAALEQNLASLVRFMATDLSNNILQFDLALLADTPNPSLLTAPPVYDASVPYDVALENMLWLTDNGVYGAAALCPYSGEVAAVMGTQIGASWSNASTWEKDDAGPVPCPDSQNGYVAGHLPYYDTGAKAPSHCSTVTAPAVGSRFPTSQAPNPPTQANFTDPSMFPWVGGDFDDVADGPVALSGPRDDFKYGVLRDILAAHKPGVSAATAAAAVEDARNDFAAALVTWDGYGFVNPSDTPGLGQIHYARNLAFALIAANALGGDPAWATNVSQADVENVLWALQQSSGGFPAAYTPMLYVGGTEPAGCKPVPGIAADASADTLYVCVGRNVKVTEEASPLVVLAYGPNIWAKASSCSYPL